ncbi:unnamed protein product, partial [Polarella glacialis]
AGVKYLRRGNSGDKIHEPDVKSPSSDNDSTVAGEGSKPKKERKSLKMKPAPEVFAEKADCVWHVKNCEQGNLIQVHTIEEAYPFEDKRKSVEKKEMCYSIDDQSRKHWGNVTVAVLGPTQLLCDVCGDLIVRRGGRKPFYVCTNCRSHRRKLELCVKCYHCKTLDKQFGDEKDKKKQPDDRVSFARSSVSPGPPKLPSGRWAAEIAE